MMKLVLNPSSGKMRDLGFAFNDKDFSDRILHLEIVRDSMDSDSQGSDTEYIAKNLNKKQKTGVSKEKGDAPYSGPSNCSTGAEIKILHVNSAILAASSPFFYKLFKNGMRESRQKDFTLRINASEEAAFMDLLNYAYSNTLVAKLVPELLDVLVVADKFEVSSCVGYCCGLLKRSPMTLESALLYHELFSSVSLGEVVKSLLDDAEMHLVETYEHITDLASDERLLTFPLSVIKTLLRVVFAGSEEDVYKFMLKWGRARYPKLEVRREILTELAGQVIYFPYLHLSTIRKIQDSPDFDSKRVSKLITESLYLNTGYSNGTECAYFGTFLPSVIGQLPLRRYYSESPIKVLEFESPPHVVVLFKLSLKDCGNGVKDQHRRSQVFFLGGHSFRLCVHLRKREMKKDGYLSMFVERTEGDHGDGSCVFDYEFAVIKDELREGYDRVHKARDCRLSVGDRSGLDNLFGVPWKEYMVHEALHLQAKFTIRNYSSSS